MKIESSAILDNGRLLEFIGGVRENRFVFRSPCPVARFPLNHSRFVAGYRHYYWLRVEQHSTA